MRRAVLSAASKDFLRRKLPSPSSMREAGAAQFAGQSERGGVEIFAERGDVSVSLCAACGAAASGRVLRLEGQHQPVEAHGKADAGRFGSAEGFAEAVVAAAAEQGVLRAEAAVRELEGGAGVVVEAANQAVIERVGNAGRVEGRGDLGEVGARVFVERVGDHGQCGDDGLVLGNFAVEHAQGVGDGAALAVLRTSSARPGRERRGGPRCSGRGRRRSRRS